MNPSSSLGRVFSIHDFKSGLNIRSCVEEYQVIILRGMSFTTYDQIMLTQQLGVVEEAWEDRHPNSKYLQLLDSRQQKKIRIKSTSKYWHLDRSFMPIPTRFTVLYAKQIGEGARGTQFLSSRTVLQSLSKPLLESIRKLKAEHSFSFRFPEIMRAKGVSEQHISKLQRKYTPSLHPLIMQTRFGESMYFSELCTFRILGVPLDAVSYTHLTLPTMDSG